MKYVRFISVDNNAYFSDILSKSCVLYIHNKLLREKNAFLIKNNQVYVNTVYGNLGVNMDNNMSNIILGERISLVHHTPNLYIVKCAKQDSYKFKVGKRYIKIYNDGKITLTCFRKLGSKFKMKYVKIIECESNCLMNFFLFKWLCK